MAVGLNIGASILLLLTGNVQCLLSGSVVQQKQGQTNNTILADTALLEKPRHALEDHKSKEFLADSSEYLKKPHRVLKKMSNHVGELESQLTNVQQQHTAEVSAQKAAFEEKLQQKAAENHKLKQGNSDLEDIIKKLEEGKQAKYDLAKSLVIQNNGLKTSLQNLVSNMTYAQEFTLGALNESDLKLRQSSELQILRDLDANDAARLHELEHKRSLKAVADPSRISMLEVGARVRRRQHPQDLLQKLAATLTDLTKEQNASIVSLQEQFDARFHQYDVRHQALSDKQSELNATKVQLVELNERLSAAVEYLKTVRDKLLEKINSVQGFMSTVSRKALPRKEEPTKEPTTVSRKEQDRKSKGTQKKLNKKKKAHKKEKAALVQVHPKVAPRKAKQKNQRKHIESKLDGENANKNGQVKAAHAKTAEPLAAEKVQQVELSSTASSWLSWLRAVVAGE